MSDDNQSKSNDIPDWAKALLSVVAIGGALWYDSATGGPEQRAAERRKRIEQYTQQAEKEVAGLMTLEYNESVAVLEDLIDDMSSEYWKFFEARLSSIDNVKARPLLKKAREFAKSHGKEV